MILSSIRIGLASLIASFVFLPHSLFASPKEQQSPWEVATSMSLFSDYMFRGFDRYNGSSFQPSVAPSYYFQGIGTFGATLWAHIPGESKTSRKPNFKELDYSLSYSVDAGLLHFSTGHTWYTFQEDDGKLPSTNEFYGTLTFDTLFSPSFSVYHDYKEYDAQYYEVTLSHPLTPTTVGETFNLTPFVTLGMSGNGDERYEHGGIVQATYGVSCDAELGEFTISPTVSYTSRHDYNTQSEFWWGFTVSYQFPNK